MGDIVEAEKILYLGRPEISFDPEGEMDVVSINYANREVDLLRKSGFGVDVARDASGAYGSLVLNKQCHPYDVLVMDVGAQAGNFRFSNDHGLVGISLLERLQQDSIRIPTIVTTDNPSNGLHDWLMENGAIGVIKKPLGPHAFEEYIRRK